MVGVTLRCEWLRPRLDDVLMRSVGMGVGRYRLLWPPSEPLRDMPSPSTSASSPSSNSLMVGVADSGRPRFEKLLGLLHSP